MHSSSTSSPLTQKRRPRPAARVGHGLTGALGIALAASVLHVPDAAAAADEEARLPVILAQFPQPAGASVDSSHAMSGVVDDPTNPGLDLFVSQVGADGATPVNPDQLVVTAEVEAKGARYPAFTAREQVSVSGAGSTRHASFDPAQLGNSTVVFTVTGAGGKTASYSLDYYASEQATPTSRFLLTSSDASTSIAAGDGHLFVADDEHELIRLYDPETTGVPVAEFSAGAEIGGEVDYESSARTGNLVFWLGSLGNSRKGEVEPSRHQVLQTRISGSGANARLTPVGMYANLRKDLVDWDQANGDRYGFGAGTAVGKTPNGPDAFNAEAAEFAPNGTTLYLGFRTPLVGGKAGGDALIVPVTNIVQLTGGSATKAKFGPPIELDLGGHSIREIRKNKANEYLILSADTTVNDAFPVTEAQRQKLWYWNGDPKSAPQQLSTELPQELNPTGASVGQWEGIGEVPDNLAAGQQIRLLMDQGYVALYQPSYQDEWVERYPVYTDFQAAFLEGQQKDILQSRLRKSRTDLVTLPGGLGVSAEASGPLVFAEQKPGATSEPQQVTLVNTGTKPLAVGDIAVTDTDGVAANDFEIDETTAGNTTVAVGQSYTVVVRFVPKRPMTTSSAELVIASNVDGGHTRVALTGSSSVAQFVQTPSPVVDTASPKVGDRLTASVPDWTPAAEFTYEWLRAGQPIAGATDVSYLARVEDIGHRLAVRVTGTADRYAPTPAVSEMTEAVAANPVATSTTLRVSGSGTKRTLAATVTEGFPGKISFMAGGRTLAVADVDPVTGTATSAMVFTPGSSPSLTAVFTPQDTRLASGSTSAAVRVPIAKTMKAATATVAVKAVKGKKLTVSLSVPGVSKQLLDTRLKVVIAGLEGVRSTRTITIRNGRPVSFALGSKAKVGARARVTVTLPASTFSSSTTTYTVKQRVKKTSVRVK